MAGFKSSSSPAPERLADPANINDHDQCGDKIDSRTLAGFNYAEAIARLSPYLSQERIAYYMGYANASSVDAVKRGRVPHHDKGEMLWALYVRVFKEDPPLSETQRAGLQDDSFLASVRDSLKKSAPKL